ncbi:hypothetical protein [Photobacterium leiognathi]|uniref:hypothetical protein n=1 Tax=Photobacterium leiognathi TaxID=553611 RepID=UPI002982150A|nr:hypothetical protein [Photobacterium leiognathi]
MAIKKEIYFGKTRRKVFELIFEMSDVKSSENDGYETNAIIIGLPKDYNRMGTRDAEAEEKEERDGREKYTIQGLKIEAASEFDVLIFTFAFFRQVLRQFMLENPSIKLYSLIDDYLELQEIDDVFWTHDCVPDC